MPKGEKIRETALFLVFVLPAVAFVMFASDIPFVMNLYYSFFDWNGIGTTMKFVGFANFKEIFSGLDPFWTSTIFTLKYTILYVVFVNVLSLFLAMLLSKENRVANVGRAFYYVTYIISLTAISLVWQFILGPAFDALYSKTNWAVFGLSWLGSSNLAFIVILVMTIWENVGFYMVNYIAGIVTIPGELLEASKIDGASRFQTFRSVTLPLLMPSLSFCILTSMTFGFKLFDVILVFTQGGPSHSTVSVAYNIYQEAFVNHSYGLATAKSLIFVVFILIITFIHLRIFRSKEVEA